ncbi:MAG TPA: hypothetical protein VIX60_03815 [Candidatus Cybelea sp.]
MQPFAGDSDDFVRDGTDGAKLLRDDEIWFEVSEQRGVELVEARSCVDCVAHVPVNRAGVGQWHRSRSGDFRES